jgi:hypothetical protein
MDRMSRGRRRLGNHRSISMEELEQPRKLPVQSRTTLKLPPATVVANDGRERLKWEEKRGYL